MRCNYCDTPESLTGKGHSQMTVQAAFEKIQNLCVQHEVKTVSITGGEPLSHVAFLVELIPLLKESGFKIYLETAGIHSEALAQIVQWCDVISMDIKLPSATGKILWNEHRKFLAVGGDKIFTKVVIESHSPLAEIDEMISVVSGREKPPTLILQPVTPTAEVTETPSPQMISKIFKRAKEKVPDVLVMTQKHKEWGIR